MFDKPSDHRLFFAVQPDEETGERMVRFARRLTLSERLGGRPVDRRRLHVTLMMVCRSAGPPSHAVLDLALRAANRVALRPFTAAFDRVQSWQASAGPLVLVGGDGVSGLERLHHALSEAHGATPVPHFTPHVSLIWNGRFLPERVIEPFSWSVREFVLIHSIQGRGRHDVLARWRLREDGGMAEQASIWVGDLLEQLQAPVIAPDRQWVERANAGCLHRAGH
ncbi:MAG: 2'-5' RNA ligase family protein [Caulobacteraceae bacterium]